MLQCVKKQLFFSTMMTQSLGGGEEIKNNLLSMHTHTHCQQKAFGVRGEGSRIMPCQASGRILLMLL